MLNWISDTIMEVVTFVPALIVDRESANFPLIRVMFGLLLIVTVVYVMAVLTGRRANRR